MASRQHGAECGIVRHGCWRIAGNLEGQVQVAGQPLGAQNGLVAARPGRQRAQGQDPGVAGGPAARPQASTRRHQGGIRVL